MLKCQQPIAVLGLVFRHLAPLAIMIVVVSCGGGGDNAPSATNPATATETPGVSPSGTRTATPVQTLQPTLLTEGDTVKMSVLPGSPGSPDTCFELLPWVVAASAAGLPGSTVEECTVGRLEGNRATFSADGSGVLYLNNVVVLLLGGAGLPTIHDTKCWEIVDHLLPSEAPPDSASAILECRAELPLSGHVDREQRSAWGMVPADSPVTVFPDGVYCWELNRYWSAALESGALYVPCLIEG